MEFKVLKRNIMIVLVVVAIISAVVLNFTRAKYRVTQSIPIVNGTINYTLPDLNVVALYIDGVAADELDDNTNYTLNTEQSTCKYKDGTEINNLTLNYNSETGELQIAPFTTKGTKCTLYFEEAVCPKRATACEAIVANNPNIDDSRSGEITGPLTEDTTGTLFIAEDDYGTSLIFAGDIDNNWVSFAGYYWRIIRINGDGSVRMIYSGEDTGSVTDANRTGETTQIGTSAFNEQSNDNAYVGYMYGTPGSDTYEETHANINDSTIKGIIYTWYQTNLASYSSYISTEQGLCNDRRVATSGENWNENDYKKRIWNLSNSLWSIWKI